VAKGQSASTEFVPIKVALFTDPNYPIKQFQELMASWEKALSQDDFYRVMGEISLVIDERIRKIEKNEAA